MKSFQSRTNSDNSEEEDINMNNSLTSNLSIAKEEEFAIISSVSSKDFFDVDFNIPQKDELLLQKRKRDDTVSDENSEKKMVKKEENLFQIVNEPEHRRQKIKRKYRILFL